MDRKREGKMGVIKRILKLWSVIVSLLLSLLLYYIFLLAFFVEEKGVYVTVNDYGEATIEIFIFSIALFLAIVGSLLVLKERKISKAQELAGKVFIMIDGYRSEK